MVGAFWSRISSIKLPGGTEIVLGATTETLKNLVDAGEEHEVKLTEQDAKLSELEGAVEKLSAAIESIANATKPT